jgi:hypothetical protein
MLSKAMSRFADERGLGLEIFAAVTHQYMQTHSEPFG